MPKGMTAGEVHKRLEWLLHIPENGRQWGQAIIDTATSLKSEIAKLEAEKKKLADEIKKRYRLLRSLPARADREVLLMGFSEQDVEGAKAQVPGDGAEE